MYGKRIVSGNFMKRHILIISTIFISGCCFYDLDKELAHFSDYKIGDTIYFQSNLGDIDTISILDFGTERNEICGGFGRIVIKHLPVDTWTSTSQDFTTDGKIDTVYQLLFSFSNYPTDKYYVINFKDFNSNIDSVIGEFHADTIKLNDMNISNYYSVKHGYPERITEPKNVATIYWTDKFGLTAYKTKDGETWTKKSSH